MESPTFIVYVKLDFNYKNKNIYSNLASKIPRFCWLQSNF